MRRRRKYNRFIDKNGKKHKFRVPDRWQRQASNKKYYQDHRDEINARRRMLYRKTK